LQLLTAKREREESILPEGIRSIDSEISKSRRQVKSNWSFSFFSLDCGSE